MISIVEKIRPATMDGVMPSGVFAEAYATGGNWAPVAYAYYWAIARLLRPQNIFEIGVLCGHSMAAMLMGAGPKCRGLGWDVEGYRANSNTLAHATLECCGVGKQATFVNQNSQLAQKFPTGHDLIHVDGEHGFEGALRDLELSLASGAATILFDDVHNINLGCAAAFKEFMRRHGEKVVHTEVLPTKTGLAVIKLAP